MQGYKSLNRIAPLREHLHACGPAHDNAGRRELHFDRSAALRRLSFFHPMLPRRRGLANVAAATGGPPPTRPASLFRESRTVIA